jgi:hypothetical protein
MIEVRREGDRVLFEVEGMHKVWALKSRLEIPLAHIRGARRDPKAVHGWKGWKAPGTYVPGLITAGTFYLHGERIFWDVRNPENAIVVDLDDDTYSQLIIEVEHPDATVELLTTAAKNPGV